MNLKKMRSVMRMKGRCEEMDRKKISDDWRWEEINGKMKRDEFEDEKYEIELEMRRDEYGLWEELNLNVKMRTDECVYENKWI